MSRRSPSLSRMWQSRGVFIVSIAIMASFLLLIVGNFMTQAGLQWTQDPRVQAPQEFGYDPNTVIIYYPRAALNNEHPGVIAANGGDVNTLSTAEKDEIFNTEDRLQQVRDTLGNASVHEVATVHEVASMLLTNGGEGVRDVVRELRAHGIEAYPNTKHYPLGMTTLPTDSELDSQWHVHRVHAPEVWTEYGITGEGVKVAVADTGINSVPDLADNIAWEDSYDFVGGGVSLQDCYGHGTPVSAVIAADDNDYQGVGIAPDAKVSMQRIGFPCVGTVTTAFEHAMALTHGVRRGAKALNLSWSGLSCSPYHSRIAYDIQRLGGLAFYAAGNGSGEAVCSPLPEGDWGSILVSATTYDDELAGFSTFGEEVDVAAPGYDIWVTQADGGMRYTWGTSYATPVVAGIAALMFEADPDLLPWQATLALKSTADDVGPEGEDIYFGAGIARADRAVAMVLARRGCMSCWGAPPPEPVYPPPPPPPLATEISPLPGTHADVTDGAMVVAEGDWIGSFTSYGPAYFGSSLWAFPGSLATATFTFDIRPDKDYDLLITWPRAEDLPYGAPERWATNMYVEVWDGGERIVAQTLNLQDPPSDVEYGDWHWMKIVDTYRTRSTSLRMIMRNEGPGGPADGPIVVDSAVLLQVQRP